MCKSKSEWEAEQHHINQHDEEDYSKHDTAPEVS